jgi:hypothetical protein
MADFLLSALFRRQGRLDRMSRGRHCEQSEAIHRATSKQERMDCFAALAMTLLGLAKQSGFPFVALFALRSLSSGGALHGAGGSQ